VRLPNVIAGKWVVEKRKRGENGHADVREARSKFGSGRMKKAGGGGVRGRLAKPRTALFMG